MSQRLCVNLGLMVGVVAFAILATFAPSLALVCGVGVVLTAGALRWPDDIPKWGLYAIVALVPLSAMGGWLPLPFFNSLTKIIFPVAFGALLLGNVFSHRHFVTGPLGLMGVLFGGAAILSYLVNEKTVDSLPVLLRLLNHVLLLLLAINVLKTRRDMATLFIVIVATCLLSALGGLLMPIKWAAGYGTAGASRLAGWTIQADAPTFGLFLLMGLLISFYYLLVTQRAWLRLVLLLVTGVLVYAMVSTYARSAFVVLVVSAGYTLFKLRKRLSFFSVSLCLVAITLAMVFLVPDSFYSRIKSLENQFGKERDATVQWRIDSARVGFNMFMQSPLLGRGPGNFPHEYLDQKFRFDRVYRPSSVIGNTYVSVAYQTGLVGVMLLGLLIFMSWRDLRSVKNSCEVSGAGQQHGGGGPASFLGEAADILQILLVALLLFSLFGAIEKEKYLWTILAAAAVLARIRRDEQTRLLPTPADEEKVSSP